MNSKPRLLRITTVPISLKLLLSGQLAYFSSKNFDVVAVSAHGPEVVNGKIDGVPHHAIDMTRKITPLRDLVGLVQLIRLMRTFKPDIVHTHTPKAGLLGMLAAWICGVPVRMHTVAGLPLMEKSGLLRKLLIQIEKLTYRCATHVYPNSLGLKKFIEANIGAHFQLRVLAKGSTNGIDSSYFFRTESLAKEALSIRKQHGIAEHDIVYSFVGRVVKDKGISELIVAFKKCRAVASAERKLWLLIVGPLEQELDPLTAEDFHFLREDKHVVLAGYQKDVRPWIMASDIFVFPSYREGFPNVVMQASCLEVPCIVSDINGCNEIIQHEHTGLIVKPKNSEELYNAMYFLTTHERARIEFARKARKNVAQDYDQRTVWAAIIKEYHDNLRSARFSTERYFYREIIKPFFDKLVALLVLVVSSPVIVICMLLLAFANRGKIWFTQIRPGKNEKPFMLVKFRTMSHAQDESGELLPDEKRLHPIGKFIRRTSLDELPQLVNVLKGDMSIVGPRPLLVEYLPLYNEVQRRRHNVKPGITGWAQVNGRNAISWEQKFEYDVWYVNNQSFMLDMKILLMTVMKVFKAEGISSATSVTMEKFRGSENHGIHEYR